MGSLLQRHHAREFRRLVPLALRRGSLRVTNAQQASSTSGRQSASAWPLPSSGSLFVAGTSTPYGDWSV